MSILLSLFWRKILLWGSVVFGVLLVLLRVRNSGRQAEKNKQARQRYEAVKQAKKIRRSVRSTPADERRKRLFEKYRR